MERDLSKLDIKDVIMEIGLYLPTIDVIQCFTDEKIMLELFERQNEMNQYDIVDFIAKNQKKFNMNRFIFANYLMMSGKKTIEGIDLRGKITNRELKMKKIEEHLAKHPILLLDADGITMKTQIYDSRDYCRPSKAKEHMDEVKAGLERLKEIDNKTDIEYLLLVQVLTDIGAAYCTVPDLGSAMRENIIVNTFKDEEGMTREELLSILNGNPTREKSFIEYIPAFIKELQENAEYIDWDKFLLVSAYRAQDTLEKMRLEDFPEGNVEALIQIMQTAVECVKNPKSRIRARLEMTEGGTKEIKYSVKDIEKALSERAMDGTYYGKKEIEHIKEEILSGKKKLSSIKNPKIINLINMTKKDKRECMNQDQSNAIYLFNNGFITEEELKEYTSTSILEDKTVEELLKMKKTDGEDLLLPKELLELYLNGNISLNSLLKAEGISPLVTESELIKQYRKLENCTPEEKARIEKYFSLFRAVKLAGKDEETKREIANNVIIELGDSMEEEDFIELYKRNIVDMENIIDWNSTEFAVDMFKKGILKPSDSKKLANNGTVDINQIKAGILNGLTDEEKISVIITMFDEENQQELRDQLFQTLGISEEEKPETREPKGKREPKGNLDHPVNPPKPESKNYEFDPCYKIQLLSLIDKDYRARLTTDGHMIFELPNLNKVIIEKMFRKNREGKIVNANDAATYALDLDTLNSEEIISNEDKINRSQLYRLAKNKKVVRYYHTKNWGDTIKEAFDIEKSERHSEQDKKKIDEIIEKSKRTRKLRTI
ncbi:MAG: hypothetical protein J6K45_03245 [Clostridia bacterium]|nr:hypothetical protein [Clostridia bacterium]